MIAESEDLFKKAGANVKIFTFDSGKTTRDAMIAGRIDIGVIGATPFVIGAAKGELEAIAIALYGAKTLSIVGGLKSGVNSVKDLKGRKVGSQLGSATDFVFQNKILPKFGLSKSDVQVINVTLPEPPIGAFVRFDRRLRRRRAIPVGGGSREAGQGAGRLQRLRSAADHSRRQQIGDRRPARRGRRIPARLAGGREDFPRQARSGRRRSCSSTSRTRASRSTTR